MKKIILRLDLNVPIKNGKIIETERIDRVIPEIKKLSKKNKLVILSHLGKGKKEDTLKPIEKYLRKKLDKEENGNIEILENVRWSKGETAKENSEEFLKTSKYFASLGDEYINDAFASMHRPHASIVGVPKIFKKNKKKVSLGEISKEEIKNLNKSLTLTKNKKNNTLLILSGAKISTKLPLIKKFLKMKAKVFVGGGVANQILKDISKINIGKSFYEKDFKLSKADSSFLAKSIKNNLLLVPVDAILDNKRVDLINRLKKDEVISDVGPVSLAILKNEIKKSKNIIMNGPLGIYEKGFVGASESLLKDLKESKGNILIGGGDTLVLTKKLRIENTKNIFISTGGGAMLDFLANNGNLPGIKALK